MESKKKTTTSRTEAETPSPGASIVVGGLFCLAAYGLYKLIKQESAPQPTLTDKTESDLIRLIMAQELKS